MCYDRKILRYSANPKYCIICLIEDERFRVDGTVARFDNAVPVPLAVASLEDEEPSAVEELGVDGLRTLTIT